MVFLEKGKFNQKCCLTVQAMILARQLVGIKNQHVVPCTSPWIKVSAK